MALSISSAVRPQFVIPKISKSITAVRNPAAITASRTIHSCSWQERNCCYDATLRQGESTTASPRFGPSRHILSPLLASKRAFSSTAQRPRDHHFDTLKFVQRLKDDGFTEEQAVAMMKVLSDVIEERCSFNIPRVPPVF
jgi:hypothetical protein